MPLSYRAYRRSFGSQYHVGDLDHVEWRMIDEVPTPVAILELARIGDEDFFEHVRWRVLDRFHEQLRGDFVLSMAEILRVDVYAVVFKKNLKSFWIGDLSNLNLDLVNEDDHWMQLDNSEYERWITNLGESDDNEER
jgi:hypothetical protein|tara:strand:- start:151 stop:561 length:411 start_codon:yes stop_codon:yes gene_type:complete